MGVGEREGTSEQAPYRRPCHPCGPPRPARPAPDPGAGPPGPPPPHKGARQVPEGWAGGGSGGRAPQQPADRLSRRPRSGPAQRQAGAPPGGGTNGRRRRGRSTHREDAHAERRLQHARHLGGRSSSGGGALTLARAPLPPPAGTASSRNVAQRRRARRGRGGRGSEGRGREGAGVGGAPRPRARRIGRRRNPTTFRQPAAKARALLPRACACCHRPPQPGAACSQGAGRRRTAGQGRAGPCAAASRWWRAGACAQRSPLRRETLPPPCPRAWGS